MLRYEHDKLPSFSCTKHSRNAWMLSTSNKLFDGLMCKVIWRPPVGYLKFCFKCHICGILVKHLTFAHNN